MSDRALFWTCAGGAALLLFGGGALALTAVSLFAADGGPAQGAAPWRRMAIALPGLVALTLVLAALGSRRVHGIVRTVAAVTAAAVLAYAGLMLAAQIEAPVPLGWTLAVVPGAGGALLALAAWRYPGAVGAA